MGLPDTSYASNPKNISAWANKELATRVQRAAMLATCRLSRFVDGHDPLQDAYDIIWKFFGPDQLPYLYEHGLAFFHREMKDYVSDKKALGSMLYRLYTPYNKDEDVFLSNYETESGLKIKLTLHGVCKHFIQEHYSGDEELDEECNKISTTSIYLSHVP